MTDEPARRLIHPFVFRETAMSNTSSSTTSEHWLPAFDQLLDTVRGCGPHGQLVDVRESLRSVLGPTPSPGDPVSSRRRWGDHRGLPAARIRRAARPARDRGPGLRRRTKRGRSLAQQPEESHASARPSFGSRATSWAPRGSAGTWKATACPAMSRRSPTSKRSSTGSRPAGPAP